jgi:branched-chain amino acid transport system ATP-binding protein
MMTLIGANGAGKTTLLLTISGVLKAASGSIDFLGVRIDKLPSHKIVALGIAQVAQGRELFPDLTVLENLILGDQQSSTMRETQNKLSTVYKYFEILHQRTNQKAGTLSGGEQQMLALARALMASPKLLLLDEPSSGLAPTVVENVIEIIANLRKEGLTIMLVEQNAHLALDLADKGYVIENGAIVATGTACELADSDLVKRSYLGA